MVLHGRRFQAPELHQVQALVTTHPEWSRYRLSRELCALWDWAHGQRAVAGHGGAHGALEAGATGLGAVAGRAG